MMLCLLCSLVLMPEPRSNDPDPRLAPIVEELAAEVGAVVDRAARRHGKKMGEDPAALAVALADQVAVAMRGVAGTRLVAAESALGLTAARRAVAELLGMRWQGVVRRYGADAGRGAGRKGRETRET